MTAYQKIAAALVLTIGWGSLAAAPPAPNLTPPELAPISLSIVRVVGALALVLALFVGGALLLRRWQTVSVRRGGSAKLAVLEARPLGNRQTIFLVGYEKQRMLVASSTAGVTLLSPLPSAETNASTEIPPSPAFADALRAVLTRS
jgi:flagellar biogenesis protein FliO